ncbi:MAG: hypothetical protein HYT30_02420 [Parcubacteria group bacterium]|nr:hypothetical protein [Parcubacteria group bacterium]
MKFSASLIAALLIATAAPAQEMPPVCDALPSALEKVNNASTFAEIDDAMGSLGGTRMGEEGFQNNFGGNLNSARDTARWVIEELKRTKCSQTKSS